MVTAAGGDVKRAFLQNSGRNQLGTAVRLFLSSRMVRGKRLRAFAQDVVDLSLNIDGQGIDLSRPHMATTRAGHRDHGEAFHNERASVLMALGTADRQGVLRVRHRGEPLSCGIRILLQSLGGNNRCGQTWPRVTG